MRTHRWLCGPCYHTEYIRISEIDLCRFRLVTVVLVVPIQSYNVCRAHLCHFHSNWDLIKMIDDDVSLNARSPLVNDILVPHWLILFRHSNLIQDYTRLFLPKNYFLVLYQLWKFKFANGGLRKSDS